MATPPDVPALLRRLATDDPTAPRLTWYAADHARTGERIELSARVLRTWVAKTANLLEEEFGVGTGSVVHVDLPTHWRTIVWQLAVWSTGADVRLDPLPGSASGGDDALADQDADVVVSADPTTLARLAGAGAETVAVDLAPLAVRYGGDLPTAVLDYARVITGYADEYEPADEPGHAGLLEAAAAAGADWPVGVRLLTAAAPTDTPTTLLAAWVRGGSVVLTPDLAAVTEDTRAAERVTTVS